MHETKEAPLSDSPTVVTLDESNAIQAKVEPETNVNIELWSKRAITVSIISILVTLTAAIAGLIIAIRDGSISVLGYAFESILDVITSSLVIWRLKGNFEGLLKEGQNDESSRDAKATVVISFLFLIISLVIGIQSIEVLATKEAPDTANSMIILAAVSVLVWVVLGLAKFKIASVLQSAALRKDAYVTWASGILTTGILIGGIAFQVDEKYFWIDGVVALIVSISLAVSGIQTLRNYKWWKMAFWKAKTVNNNL